MALHKKLVCIFNLANFPSHPIILPRYASTLVTSEVENTEEVAREVFFNVILPETAFISR